jgi:aspartyl-tRNA(Asn)/glutamyl-tRNA(Gln) amidotransferase subunit A
MDIPLTITETQKGLLEKRYTAVDLVDAYLARINTFDKDINAFITVSEELAYEQAKKTDRLIEELGKKAFEQFPLLGVVTAYKDIFLTKGVRTTAASKVLESYVPEYSATAVERLESAGAICIGKTNLDAWAHGGSGENSQFGPTKNPWDKERVPGGSSSGSAASMAANFSLIATGTDTGGSIRQPSSLCGLVGLKPTYGAVSRYGVISMGSSLDTIGHFSRTVEDSRKIFSITKGQDGKDGTVVNESTVRNHELRKLKIGIPKEYFVKGIDSEVEASVRNAAKELEKQGVELVEISLPHTKYAVSVYYIVMAAEVSSNLGRFDGIRYGNVRSAFGDEAKRRIMLGSYVLSAGYYDAYYLKAMKVRTKLREDFDNAFAEVDAILAPVSPTPAFKIGEKANDPLQMYLEDIYTVAANLAGIPGLALPCGFTKSGLPLGFQLLGPRFGEDTLFDLGEMYQKETDWHFETARL